MNKVHNAIHWLLMAGLFLYCGQVPAQTQTSDIPFQPYSGQAGKDVVWVPTPPELVEKMLDVAGVTSRDYVIDLGSGDGRNIIAAAKRGARSLGVEFNPDMVALSQRSAAAQGVADKAMFVQGDMFEADISQATVLALFLLPDNLRKLQPKFAALKPGTRMVMNTFGLGDWEADETHKVVNNCDYWCTALLYIVPARVEGIWRLAQGELILQQSYQKVTGVLRADGVSRPIVDGRLRGDEIAFSVEGKSYAGRVTGESMSGEVKGGATWTASRLSR